jgi:hypothetical protein
MTQRRWSPPFASTLTIGAVHPNEVFGYTFLEGLAKQDGKWCVPYGILTSVNCLPRALGWGYFNRPYTRC